MEYLVVMEVSQKQNYIFRTNRLAENIGASIIIKEVTEVIPKEYAKDNFVYEGGGKSLYQFDNRENAKSFIGAVSTEVILKYPGVELYMALNEYNEETESIIDAINVLYSKLETKKASKKYSFNLYGLGMTEQCESTQLPAILQTKYQRNISGQVLKKLDKASSQQKNFFKGLLPSEKCRFANSFDELGGKKGEKNYIAVIVLFSTLNDAPFFTLNGADMA